MLPQRPQAPVAITTFGGDPRLSRAIGEKFLQTRSRHLPTLT